MISLTGTKILVLVLMTVLTMGACFLPILVRRLAEKAFRQNGMKMFMSGCLCFGGGVLLATIFLHLMPETHASLERAIESGFLHKIQYPLTELMVCLGFFIVYIMEEIVHMCVSNGQERCHSHGHDFTNSAHQTTQPALSKYLVKETSIDGDEGSVEIFLPQKEADLSTEEMIKESRMTTLHAILVVVALSVHSIMEGLALGLTNSNKDVWVLFGALCTHKLIIAFCMAMELLNMNVSRLGFFISLTIFSVASPLGGLAGTLVVYLITQTTTSGILVPIVLYGLSAGTLLYVTFCEILARERANSTHPITKMLGLIGGFALMAGLQVIDSYYVPQEDSGLPTILTTAFPIQNRVLSPYIQPVHF